MNLKYCVTEGVSQPTEITYRWLCKFEPYEAARLWVGRDLSHWLRLIYKLAGELE